MRTLYFPHAKAKLRDKRMTKLNVAYCPTHKKYSFAMIGHVFVVTIICALSFFGGIQTKANAQDKAEIEIKPPETNQSPGSKPRERRARQNIDEPQLEPMFGRRDDDTGDQIDSHEQNFVAPVVEKLSGFTSILTLLTPEETQLSLGIGPVFKPDYFGSDDYEVQPDPQVFIQFQNFSFFDDDGADLALFGFSGFKLGPSLRLVGDRREEENPALEGLGDVGVTFELGGFASTTFRERYSFKFKVRRGIATGHRGLIVDACGTALLFRYGRFSTSISAQASWIGNDYADTFFSITDAQSTNSGLRQFEARSGFRNLGGSLNGYINLGQRWSLNPYIQYDYIIGNVADSPLVADLGSRNQFRTGFHLIRQFKLF